MFGSGTKSKCSSIDTVIGAQTTLQGDIHFSGGLHIDGKVTGNIIANEGADAVLTISEQGRIEGNINVPNLVLNGNVVGDVHIGERVELASHAKVTGDVYYYLIEMASGAEVNGSLLHQTQKQKSTISDRLLDELEQHTIQAAK